MNPAEGSLRGLAPRLRKGRRDMEAPEMKSKFRIVGLSLLLAAARLLDIQRTHQHQKLAALAALQADFDPAAPEKRIQTERPAGG